MNKKMFLSICAAACLSGVMAQPKMASVSGHTTRAVKEPVKLFTITHGRLEEIASSKVDVAGQFGFLFYPAKESFYVIGIGTAQTAMHKYSFYFKPGDELNVDINDSSYTLAGKNTSENKALANWHDRSFAVEQPSIYSMKVHETYKEFFPKFETYVAGLSSWKPLPTANKRFDAAFAQARELDVLSYALGFVTSPNTVFPTAADYTPYYRSLKIENYTNNGRLLEYPFGIRVLSTLQMAPAIIAGTKFNVELDTIAPLVKNDTLRGELVLQNANRLKTYLGYAEMTKTYGKYIITDDQKARAAEVEAKLAKAASKPGQTAINFTYPNLDGKMTSLTDFKGKVVLVDVWATWCGPCKQEIPHLKKMEEEMRGTDVVFMSVSVDEEKDHQKWKDFIAKEELKGVQLFAAGWSAIAKNYDIKGIPRFMVFDKQGNIVTIDAPRPSGKELKLLLESELKK